MSGRWTTGRLYRPKDGKKTLGECLEEGPADIPEKDLKAIMDAIMEKPELLLALFSGKGGVLVIDEEDKK